MVMLRIAKYLAIPCPAPYFSFQLPRLQPFDQVSVVLCRAMSGELRQALLHRPLQLILIDGLAVDPGNNFPGLRPTLFCGACVLGRRLCETARHQHHGCGQPEVTDPACLSHSAARLFVV
jgi:hypothetical protein